MSSLTAGKYVSAVCWQYLEKGHGGAVSDHAIVNLGLLRNVIGRVDGRVHPLHDEEGGEVGRVG